MKIAATFSFEAAHHLPHVPDGHKCKRLHGHNYKIEVSVDGPLDHSGFVVDYADLEHVVDPLIMQLDHRCLNDIEGLQNPTAELIVNWFLERIKPAIGSLGLTVRVYETPRYWAEASA